jgi:hypothetical protein
MSVKALSLFVTGHYPCARQAETLHLPATYCRFQFTPPEKDQEFPLYA